MTACGFLGISVFDQSSLLPGVEMSSRDVKSSVLGFTSLKSSSRSSKLSSSKLESDVEEGAAEEEEGLEIENSLMKSPNFMNDPGVA